jgi:hypothetical protein
MVCRTALCLAVCLSILPMSAGAQSIGDPIAAADAAFDEGDLTLALAGYEAALAAGGLEHDRYVHVVTRTMLARSARRDEEGTRAAARLFLAIDGLPVPSELSRLARGWVEAERASSAPHALLEARSVAHAVGGDAAQVRVRVGAPDVRLELRVGTRPIATPVLVGEPGQPWVTFALAERLVGPVTAVIVFLDGQDNEILLAPLRLEPASDAAVELRGSEPTELELGPASEPTEPELGPVPEAIDVASTSPVHAGWPDELVVAGAIVSGVGLAAFAGFFTATLVGWDSLQRCPSPDCEPHLDWTPELADVSIGIALVGAVLLVVGLLSGSDERSSHTVSADDGSVRW